MKKAMAAPNERDDLLEQWLRRGRQGAAAATESCLDAETAAAFVARGLTGASLEQAQAHLADCARCQAVIGVLVRADLGGQSAEPARDPRR